MSAQLGISETLVGLRGLNTQTTTTFRIIMRKFLIIAGLFFLLFVGALVALVLSPPVHKAAFLWAMDGKVDDISVDSVRFTGSSFAVENFTLFEEGVEVAADKAEVHASWLDFARTQELHIDSVKVSGLKADLETVAMASGGGLGAWLDLLGKGEPQDTGPFRGILETMTAPESISIGEVRLDGQVLLPDEQFIDINLALDDFARGQKARIRLQGAFLDQAGESTVNQANYELTLDLDQGEDGKVNGLAGTLGLNLVGEKLNPAGQLDLNGNWNLAKTATGELISVFLAETGNNNPLIDTEFDLNVTTGDLKGRLSASLNGALVPVELLDLPPFVTSASFSTRGDVNWNYLAGVGSLDLQGAGVLEERPLQYHLKGSGAADALPAISGFVKTGFSDEGGPVTLTVNLDVNSRGDGQVVIPVSVQRGNRTSKLSIRTDIKSLESRFNPFELSLSGDSVFLADLQSVGKALAGWGYGMQQLDTIEQGRQIQTDGVPWQGLTGNANLAIQQLILPQGFVLEGVNGRASIRPDSVSLTSFNLRIDRGSIQAKADLIHSAKSQTPYTLRVDGAVSNIPSDLLDLGRGSPITGNWNGSLSMLGQSKDLGGLADSVQLSLDLEGSSGLLQFSKINENADKAAKVMQLGALLGQFIKDDRLTAITQMTQYLQCVPYNSIRFKVDRLADGKVAIHEFTVQGPELLLTGNGSINANDWVSLADGALSMNLAMGTKGRFGQNASILGLTSNQLSGEYQLWRKPINFSGTLSNSNYAALKDMILGALR